MIDGSGKIAVGNNTMDYKAGDSFFVTAREQGLLLLPRYNFNNSSFDNIYNCQEMNFLIWR